MSIENIRLVESVPPSDWTGPLPDYDDDLTLECYQSSWYVRGTAESASFATPEDRRHYIGSECSVGDYASSHTTARATSRKSRPTLCASAASATGEPEQSSVTGSLTA